MPKADLSAVYDQADFSQILELGLQPQPSDGLVPFSHSDGRVIQQPAQAPDRTQQLGWTWDLPRNPAQAHRPALIDTDDQPGKIANLGISLSRTQFLNSMFPGNIEVVDWHWITPLLKRFRKTIFGGGFVPINYSFVKVLAFNTPVKG
jgi:hypothetical protein